MDARTESKHIPLCVDLDGTLVATDTLWEAVVAILFRNPLMLFQIVAWALAGNADGSNIDLMQNSFAIPPQSSPANCNGFGAQLSAIVSGSDNAVTLGLDR